MPKRTTTKATKAGRKSAAGRPARSSTPPPEPKEILTETAPDPAGAAPAEPAEASEGGVATTAPAEAEPTPAPEAESTPPPETTPAPPLPSRRERVLKVARPWGHPAVDGFRNELHEWLNAVWEGRVPEGERLILEV